MSTTQQVASAAAIMTVIGAIDGIFDSAAGPRPRALWKTLLGMISITVNVNAFSPGGKFENASHLRAYITALVAAALYAISSSRLRVVHKSR
jgi:hypothetical protein